MKRFLLSDEKYNMIKALPLYISAIVTAYVGLGAIWGFPYTGEIAKSATVVNALILALLKASSWAYDSKLKEELKENGDL